MNVQNEVPIIWRSPDSEFNNDEPLSASKIYTPKVLRGIKENGFNAIWMRGRLWELGSNSEFPELNDSKASERLKSLNQVIGDASEIGLKVFLYFNEPLALPEDHLFWANHPEMKGEEQFDGKTNETFPAFCTSAPRFMGLFNTAVSDMFRDLRGLGGVILITASEYHSHCWSHHPGNPVHKDERFPDMKCERCRDREPAEVVGELAEVWLKHAKLAPGTPDVWVWNWSWAMWYDQPQAEVIAALPKGVKLMCDFERGNLRKQAIGDVFIDEYSLGFVGPSERFSKSRDAAAKRGIEVAAKLQIGTTHELATVPNIPVIGNLFDKLVKIDELDLKGLMCSWNFGNTLTANTAMFGFFFKLTQEERLDRKRSLARFAESYFGLGDSAGIANILEAWDKFAEALGEYPFSNPMLYHTPMNYAPAFPLSFRYNGRPMGPSWIPHEPFGDDLSNCLSCFTLDQVIECYSLMSKHWNAGLKLFETVLSDVANSAGSATSLHCFEELSCVKMISCHIDAMLAICEFQKWRDGILEKDDLKPPCDVPADDAGLAIIARHRAAAKTALSIMRKDSRFGFHQEPHHQFFDIERLEKYLATPGKD